MFTSYGTRPIAEVKSDIDAYLTGHYAGFVDGVFFDEMSNDLANTGYYRELADYVKSQQVGARTIGNPGTTFVINPSNQSTWSSSDFAASLDTIATLENTAGEYLNNYTPPVYLDDKTADGFAHIVHTLANWDASFLQTAAARKAGFVYISDDVMSNPYDQLPTYWNQFTSDLSAFNAVPEPTAAGLVFISSLGIIAAPRRRRA